MNTHTKQISIRVTVEEFAKLNYYCNTAYISKNQVIRNWIQALPDPPKKRRAK